MSFGGPASDTLPGRMATHPDSALGSGTKKTIAALAVALVFGLLGGLAPAAEARPAMVYVNGDSSANYKFTPPTVKIRRKQTVRWEWDSNGAHNVTFRKPRKQSKTGASEHFRLKFKKRGTFKYRCTIHDFHGKVVVK